MKAFIAILLFAGAYALPATRDPMINPGMFEGDMFGVDPNEDRNAISDLEKRWPKGVVPYVIDTTLEAYTDLIESAMKHIAERTCIEFVKKQPEHKDYIHILVSAGCWSLWGRAGIGKQPLSLGSGCLYFGTVVHELMHAIGFEHEHNRSDRDDYVTINWDNIEERWYSAFKKLLPTQNRLLSPFDYNSIMLYGDTAFSKGYGLKTIIPKDGRHLPQPYERKTMSPSDFERVIALYECREPLKE